MRSRSHSVYRTLGLPLAALCWLAVTPDQSHAETEPAAACIEAEAGENCAATAATLDTREVARRAAVRRNRQEQRAIRELLVQSTGLCQRKPEQYCSANNRIGCAEQLRQTCASLANRAVQCKAQAKQFCAQQRGGEKCLEQVSKQCPSSKRQNIDTLLARYEDLTPVQKARVKQLAKQLEANKDESKLGALVNGLLGLLGFG